MRELFIDIETFSPVNLAKSGVYPYADHAQTFCSDCLRTQYRQAALRYRYEDTARR